MNLKQIDLLRWMRHNLIPSKQNGWKLFNQGQLLYLEYPIEPQPRYGHGKPPHPQLTEILNRDRARYLDLLNSFTPYFSHLGRISKPTPNEWPTFLSSYFPGMDAVALYSLIRNYQPKRYIEIGSGHSTHFARMAIHDGGLNTHITCIDAYPRKEIKSVADTIIEKYLENVDLAMMRELEAGDIFFFDGSHRAFTNSDVSIFFLEILPILKPGVLVHIHDIYLPEDYPPRWRQRYYSEQYLLACYLLSENAPFDVLFPIRFMALDTEFRQIIDQMWGEYVMYNIPKDGLSFWLVKS